MKKFYLKYLPSSGEITETSRFQSKDGKFHECRNIFESYPAVIEDENGLMHDEDNCKKLNLFLCSSDIQAGDKLRCYKPDMTEWTECEFIEEISTTIDGTFYETYQCKYTEMNDKVGGALKENFYKVIGEVSWKFNLVKEGDEFDEDEITIKEECPKCGAQWNDGFCPYDVDCEIDKKERIVYIKGSCGHFH